ncbi:MAG: DUF930 domain-containing protein, partial [Pseudomonadota bacterium]
DIFAEEEEHSSAEETQQGIEEETSGTEEEELSEDQQPQTAELEQPVTEDEPEVAVEESPQGFEEEVPSATAEVEPAERVEAPLPMIRRAYQFGEETSGPEQSDTGEALEEPETAEVELSEASTEDSVAPETVVSELSAPGGDLIVLPEIEETPVEPAETEESLRSQNDNDSSVATTAINDTPRSERAQRLCTSELERVLLQGSWQPNLVPKVHVTEGTVREENNAAFQTKSAQWLKLQYRCEIDQDATKVVAFEYKVGEPIPREEWGAWKFPDS